jgi:small GTP-binding protein
MQIIVLGDGAVGKTSLLKRYSENQFSQSHMATIGLDFVSTKFTPPGESDYNVKIWDTAGQDRFKTITYSFYKQADGVLIAFDVTNEQSFENVKNWINSINENADKDIVKMLIATKIDMEDDRKISKEEGEELASEFGMPYLETSAKADINVKASILAIMEKVYIQLKHRQTTMVGDPRMTNVDLRKTQKDPNEKKP